MIFRYPTNYIAITTFFKKGVHWGIDLGWRDNSKEYGPNMPIYASADGVVYATHDKDRTGKSWGNYVKIKHNETTYTMYAHLKEGSIKVKKGDKVYQGQQIANMGKSGIATGPHCHFEIYMGGVTTNYRVDPLPLTYAFPDQIVCNSDKNVVKYYIPVVEPVERNEDVNQLKILKEKLRIRTEPSLKAEILDFAKKDGIYNDLEIKEVDGYIWHKIADHNWLAQVDGYVELLPKVEFRVGDIVALKEPIQKYKITSIENNKVSIIPITDLNNLIKEEK